MAEAFAAAGCSLALCARHPEPTIERELAERFRVPVLVRACDVRSEAAVREFFTAVRERYGRVDVLVNNAGVAGPAAKVEEIKLDDWRAVLETNATGTMLCARSALALMQRGGTIVNTVSVAGRQAFPRQGAYIAAKHAVRGLTDTLREELRERGIRVIGFYPGATATDIWSQFWPSAPKEQMMRPETLAQAVVQAVLLPPEATVEELVMQPTAGALK
jgi:NAD(P)-dependent dehydrogenase (short-subunit alcohol dehydrogenase family)